jgi:hypothetical protein
MHEGKLPLGKPRAYPVSLASGKPHLVQLSLFGFGLSELGIIPVKNFVIHRQQNLPDWRKLQNSF